MQPRQRAAPWGPRADKAMCLVDPTGSELHWSIKTPQTIGVFVLAIGVILAVERHEFTSPNLGLLLILLIVTPWVLDMLGWPPLMRTEARLRYPTVVLWSVAVIALVYWLGVSYYINIDFAPFVVVVLIGEMASTVGPRFGAVVLAAAWVMLVVQTAVHHFAFESQIIWAFAFLLGWLGGTAYRNQLQIATELAKAQEELAEKAAEDERHRLAREVHDLIAHSLAVTMLQLSGARLALQAGDTEEAVAALSDAESAGRAAMAEIHRTVGLLGPGGDEPPTPCASDLPGLVDGFKRAGLEVRFDLHGDLSQVPLAAGLATYRVVQESLSNAVKHAPGAPVTVQVRVETCDVDIRVVNPVTQAPSPAPGPNGSSATDSAGQGIRGMSERAELLGGTARACNGDGTWKVEAHIPWNHPA